MSATINTFSCIILAGGEGRRFGYKDKGLILLNDKPLIEHVVEALTPTVDDIVISANRNLDFYKQYSDTVIADHSNEYRGPLSGIASSLPYCKNPWVLIVPCDMQSLPSNLLKDMIQQINDEQLCIVENNNHLQLVILMQRDLLNSLKTSLAAGHYKFLDWVKSQHYTVRKYHDPQLFININSEDQLLSFQST